MSAIPQRYSWTLIGLQLISVLPAIILQQWWWLMLPTCLLLSWKFAEIYLQQTAQLFWWWLWVLPLSTELAITDSLSLDFPGEPLLILLTGAVLLLLITRRFSLPVPVYQSNLLVLVLLHLFWIGITILFSREPILSLKYLLAKCWYVLPLVILPSAFLQRFRHWQQMALALCIPMLLVVVQSILRHAAHGFSFEGIKDTLNPFFRNHVNYSGMLVCLLPIGIGIYLLTDEQRKKRKLGIALVIAILGLILAYSRGAWVVAIAGLFVYWLIKRKWLMHALVMSSIVISLALTWLLQENRFLQYRPDFTTTIFHTDFTDHMAATLALKDVSNAERFYRWTAGVAMAAEEPLTGFGPNSFYLHYKPYAAQLFRTWVSNNPDHSTVHNYYLLLALEQGLPGLLVFLIILFVALYRAQYLFHRLQTRLYSYAAMIAGVMLSMIALLNTMSDLIETDKIGGLFWLCIGVIIALEGKLQEERTTIA
ncbi:MAG: O-antigen ligase family protein [Chitinophagaceae bacterium]|nr:O-antigen ligase family protein [Chitinophagaceae bacterium]